jgi:hypothetical protein
MKNLILIFSLIIANICSAQDIQSPETSQSNFGYYEKISSLNNKNTLQQKADQWSQTTADNPDSIERKGDTIIFKKNAVLSSRHQYWNGQEENGFLKKWDESKEDEYVQKKIEFKENKLSETEVGYFEEKIHFTVQVVCQDSQYQCWIKDILFTNRYEGILGDYDSTQSFSLFIFEFIKLNGEIATIENDSSIGRFKKKRKLERLNNLAAHYSVSFRNINYVFKSIIANLKENID